MKSITRFHSFFITCLSWLLVLHAAPCAAQKTYLGREPFVWEKEDSVKTLLQVDEHKNSDLVILSDKTQFYFYGPNNKKVRRNLIIKINTDQGLHALQTYKLPESFDEAYDAHLYKQGRRAKITIPYLTEYQVNQFAARKFSDKKWKTVSFNDEFETIHWIKSSGEYANDNISLFKFKGLRVGDIIEIYYELTYNGKYGSDLFYFNTRYPKLYCEYDFIYKLNIMEEGFAFLLPVYINDSLIKRSFAPTESESYNIHTCNIRMKGLQPINYPSNSCEGKSLPHVYMDFNYIKVVKDVFSTPDGKAYDYGYTRPKNFEWLMISDTMNHYTKIYDKKFAALRKFVSTLPPVGADSSHKIFFKALCDTLNSYRYLSRNQIFYNESNLLDISSADHLLKRRLVGSGSQVCEDILNDNGIFYYTANVQDLRYGEHSLYYRAHYGYEHTMFAVPSAGSYIYFIPRYSGIKYHLNELPFYFEGTTVALSPENFQESTKGKEKQFKFIKTHKGTYNENTRTENATARISLDSLKAGLVIKESLSGQFSTVLRHLYLNEYIDSTIAPYYFKKCTDKPNASHVKIKLSSHITDFPFRYTFNCTERLAIPNATALDLHNWFSFLISENIFPEVPTHDYYFDFDFSDSYNFLLDFSAPVTVTNMTAFSKKINNDYFELESEIVQNSETAYLLKIKLLVKQRMLPQEKMALLTELITSLDALNNFSLQLQKK